MNDVEVRGSVGVESKQIEGEIARVVILWRKDKLEKCRIFEPSEQIGLLNSGEI
jgi:hypothetical protein